tara:strand:+ start:2441 stop:3862 length:1422 start_codon:yes stop_codon:yes gene_type:complete
MTIKRFFATADNTITNAFDQTLSTRGTGSNMGASDILEVFSIYGQATTTSLEAARILIQFDTADILAKRSAGLIPASGSVDFYLKLCNAEHSRTLPRDFYMHVTAVSQSWQEGVGIDMDNYTDLTRTNPGSNWINASNTQAWTTAGGDYFFDVSSSFVQRFEKGTENLDINVSPLVEQWLDGRKQNYGFGIRMSGSYESGDKSYYTKKFFARGSEFFFKRPVLEARWNGAIKDDRGYFYASSSLAEANDNLNTLYLYNRIRGRLKNIPVVGNGNIHVSLYDSIGGSQIGSTFTGSNVSTGVYRCDVFADTTKTTIHDVWHAGSNQYHTGTINVKSFKADEQSCDTRYLTTISNLQNYYNKEQTTRFNLYVRPKNWSPNIYTVASSVPQNYIIVSGAYEIYRIADNYKVIPFGTGSDYHTSLSYDVSGNYFELDLSMLEDGYDYGIRFAYYDDYLSTWQKQSNEFRFKVRKDEY